MEKHDARAIFWVAIYWLFYSKFYHLGFDQLFMGGTILLLTAVGKRGHSLRAVVAPFFLTLILYDSQRFYADFLRGTVHIVEPYNFDKHFFGIATANGVLTPNEWFQLHTHPVLDFLTGIAYFVFCLLYLAIDLYFYFWIGRTGTRKRTPAQVKKLSLRMGWAFFWVNLIGYSTYYWYPAAPPWYVAKYGFGPPNFAATASMAGCERFDKLMGTHLFTQIYGRSTDVFGSIPSLHVAYPLMAIIFAFSIGSARAFCIGFYLLMAFAAVYLNHHYVLDVLWGSAYGLLVALVFSRSLAWQLHTVSPRWIRTRSTSGAWTLVSRLPFFSIFCASFQKVDPSTNESSSKETPNS